MSIINNIPSNVYQAQFADSLKDGNYIDGVLFSGRSAVTHYGVCSTAANVVAKTVTLSDSFTLNEGVRVDIKFSNVNTADNPTLNVNNTGAKAIVDYAGTLINNDITQAGSIVTLIYDGNNWVITNSVINFINDIYNQLMNLQLSNTITNRLITTDGHTLYTTNDEVLEAYRIL